MNTTAGAMADLEFASRLDGSVQRYMVRLPPEGETRRDALIALHGHG